jgi:hypothetical protein
MLNENCTSGSLGTGTGLRTAGGSLRTTASGICVGIVAARSLRFAVTLCRFFFI